MQLYTNTLWNWFTQQLDYTKVTRQHKTNLRNESVLLLYRGPFVFYTTTSKETTFHRAERNLTSLPHNMVISFAQRIDEVRSALAISVSDLAAILDVTRPTIYTFMDGKEPVEDADTKYARMAMLQLLSKKIKESGLAIPCNQILRRRNHLGKSLKDLLEKNVVTESDLDAFVSAELEQQQENYRRIALAKKKKTTQKLKNPEAISAPYYFE